MSFGSLSASSILEGIFNDLYDDGILLIASSGNGGGSSGDEDVFNYPAAYDSVISVAALTSDSTHAAFSNENSQVEIAAEGAAVLSTSPVPDDQGAPYGKIIIGENSKPGYPLILSSNGTETANLVDGGLCRAVDIDLSWQDGIVICERGDNSYRDKVDNTENSGALATIIFNDQPGMLIGSLDSGTSSKPAIGISQGDGQKLLADYLGQEVSVITDDGATTTPGSGGYRLKQGTSMSAAYVSGTAALVWSACPSLTNIELRELLGNTAQSLPLTDLPDEWDKSLSVGSGMVQAFNAWHTCQQADLGDLSRKYGQARHLGDGTLRLGQNWAANSWIGDYPGAGHDDENDDGIVFVDVVPGGTATVYVTTSSSNGQESAYIQGWMDFNHDDNFAVIEMIVDDPLEIGITESFTFPVPSTLTLNLPVNFRFRLLESAPISAMAKNVDLIETVGTVQGGEVEDGSIFPQPTAVTFQGWGSLETRPRTAFPLTIAFVILLTGTTLLHLKRTRRNK